MRAPRLGEVKTRLAAGVGPAAALRIYRRLAEHALRVALEVPGAPEVAVHYTPHGAGEEMRTWLGEAPRYLPQCEGDLGARMHAAFAAAFARGHTRVLAIGSDLPQLGSGVLGDALDLLDSNHAVLGPACDGGYYLLGMKRMIEAVFCDLPWSTPRLLELTRERLRAEGCATTLLPVLADVDRAEDLPAGWLSWALGDAP